MMLASLVAAVILVGCGQQAPEKKAAPKVISADNFMQVDFAELDLNDDGTFTYDEFDKITSNKGST